MNIPTIEEIRAGIRPDTLLHDYETPGEPEPVKYQVTLYVTDEQMATLNRLIDAEYRRVEKEQKKPNSLKIANKLETLADELKAIRSTVSDNVW